MELFRPPISEWTIDKEEKRADNYPMLAMLIFLIPILIIAAVALIGSALISAHKKKAGNKQVKDRNTILKEANRRLSSNPKDSKALLTLAELHYAEENYSQAMKTYGILLNLCATNSKLDEQSINLYFGLSAMKTGVLNEAYKSLTIARRKYSDNFEINASLGNLEYKKKNYEKSVALTNQALNSKPDDKECLRYCGLSLYKLHRYKSAVTCLKKAASGYHDDPEILFALARSLYELNQIDQSLKIFTLLRTDPEWGPKAALYSGTINKDRKAFEQAVMDLELGLKHKNISADILMELKYRLAESYNQINQLSKALAELNDLYGINPKYKDVEIQRKKLEELTRNRNLQIYMLAPSSEFINLCRQLTGLFFPKTRIKIQDISAQSSEYVDILADIKAKRWEDIILFRYYRGEGKVRDLAVRELYAHVKETHAGRGFCITAGTFSTEASKFVEARLIDLVPKSKLVKLLKKLDLGA